MEVIRISSMLGSNRCRTVRLSTLVLFWSRFGVNFPGCDITSSGGNQENPDGGKIGAPRISSSSSSSGVRTGEPRKTARFEEERRGGGFERESGAATALLREVDDDGDTEMPSLGGLRCWPLQNMQGRRSRHRTGPGRTA